MVESRVMVSVCMITYNQESYIAQAIEGVLMQKTNFKFELIIGEDCSTDNTQLICKEYKNKYPDIVKLLLAETNLGANENFHQTVKMSLGKYLALCEGDDYWTDPYKLQKQVCFLEANKDISFCCHNAITYYVDKNFKEDFNKKLRTKIYKTNDLLIRGWFLPTASLLIRKEIFPDPFPNWFYNMYSGDYAMELLLSIKGDFYYSDEKMSVYRKNAINSLSATQLDPFNHLYKKITLLKNFSKSQLFSLRIVIYYSICNTRFQILRAKIYTYFPIIVLFKNKLKRIID
jgi:glycosyltransferase involved in cell wall biosynthesis